MPRRLAALPVSAALSAALLAGGLLAVPARADDVPAAQTLHFDVAVGPKRDQHCDVVADLYRPAGASSARRVPAILTTNGFGGSKDDQAAFGRAYAGRGYAVLSYSGLGFGGSGCRITLDHPDWDGAAASQLVDFLAGAKAAKDGTRLDIVALDRAGDPRVGMAGGSYGGQVQFAAAAMDGRIDALVPMITWNDLRYSLAPNNQLVKGALSGDPGVTKLVWALGFFGEGVAAGITNAQTDPSRLVGCPNFPTVLCQAVGESLVFGLPQQASMDYMKGASVASYLPKIKAPTLLVQGQADTLFDLQEGTATYRALAARRTPVSMIWQSAGHSGGRVPGDSDLSDTAGSYVGARAAAWFDHYLKGLPVSTGPSFAYFRPWVGYQGSAAPAYGTAPTRTRSLYLSGRDKLVGSRASVVKGAASYSNPLGWVPTSFSEVSAVQGALGLDDVPPADAPGTFAAWTSAPLTANTDVAGMPALSVRLDSPAAVKSQRTGVNGRLVLFAKLYDVAPDGSASLVHRLVSPVRVRDVREPLSIQLPGIVHRFAAGHRLRVAIASSDLSYLGNRTVLPVTVRTDPKAPGVLTLPVIG
ncbi:CocE/NonD family hydrolase [Actinomadura fibrosa]|uniref:CocE/NonD family hydrolase n=1 Tax=Actinomadura fibrosa TaxID=111802 RepID=A0ABW2XRS2_9ACTN|nr:CocE/NonD family hydrolase [Actinomadura fibrosa]